MFGYICVNRPELKVREYEIYRGYYCGLCYELYHRFGPKGQLLLNYDMTFLAMLLDSVYEPRVVTGKGRCLPHPAVPHREIRTKYTSYAADMTILLAWHKAKDDWTDERSAAGAGLRLVLAREYRRLRRKYPRQAAALEQQIAALGALEASGEENPEKTAECSGRFLAEIFVCREDMWARRLREMGYFLGRFIYLMDALEDREKDKKKGRFNGLEGLYRKDPEGFGEACEELLVAQMSGAAASFEHLPAVRNLSVLRNILYSGVWVKYRALNAAPGKGSEESK